MNFVMLTGYVYKNAVDGKQDKYVYFEMKLTSKFRSYALDPIKVVVFGSRETLDLVLIECRKGNSILVTGEMACKKFNSLKTSFIVTTKRPKLIVNRRIDITHRKFKNLQLNYFSNDDYKSYVHKRKRTNRFKYIKAIGENKDDTKTTH